MAQHGNGRWRIVAGEGGIQSIPGVHAAHVTKADTGCTVVVTPATATAAVDVRGGGPGTRETDLLDLATTISRIHAIVLCGGSAFGLATCDGVMNELEARGIGFSVLGPDTPGPIVPLVPGAVIFDLLVGDPTIRPTAADGAAATAAALDSNAPLLSGSVGAGTGATAGTLRGGIGQATRVVTIPNGAQYRVAALMVANPVGNVVDPHTHRLWEGRSPEEPAPAIDMARFQTIEPLATKLNTTIGVVVTDAPVSAPQLKRMAMVGHDGIARMVRPAHSPFDGDTIFGLSTAADDHNAQVDPETLGYLGQAAADAVAGALADAVLSASTSPERPAYLDLVVAE